MRLALLVLFVVACGDDSNPPPPEGEVTLRLEVEPAIVIAEDGANGAALATAWIDDVRGGPIAVRVDRWWLSSARAAEVDAEGVIRSTGRAGGTVRVFAELQLSDGRTARGEGLFRVEVKRNVLVSPGAAPALVRVLDETPVNDDPIVGPQILAPLDGALLPSDVAAPEVHWDATAPGDTVRVRVLGDGVEVRGHLVHEGPGFPDAWTIDPASWALVTESVTAPGLRPPPDVDASPGAVRIVVERFDRGAGVGVRGAPRDFSVAGGALHGALAYWEVQTDPATSHLARLDLRRGTVETLGVPSRDCSGCHAVSADGARVAATLDLETSAFYAMDGTNEVTLDRLYDAFAFASDGNRVLASYREDPGVWPADDSRLALLDAAGATIAATGLPTEVAASPVFSPSGDRVAWVRGGSDHPDGTDAATAIVVQSFSSDTFGEPQVLHEGDALDDAPEAGVTDARPSFGPAGELLAFAHGNASGSRTDATSALYVVRTSDGTVRRLDRGMGPEGSTAAFWPIFLPVQTTELGGRRLQWLVFYSRAPHGNDRVGTRAHAPRQLWMMAIDPDRFDDGDPSHPPFRLTGQSARHHAMAAQWIAGACSEDTCTTSAECCAGTCVEGACVAPECAAVGTECLGVGCCGDAVCDAQTSLCAPEVR
ncbi:MAG: hypothetical protein H6720_17820 [Sandaracinus sp.]|nr:hypothetical protein [Sandaracinus sp.]